MLALSSVVTRSLSKKLVEHAADARGLAGRCFRRAGWMSSAMLMIRRLRRVGGEIAEAAVGGGRFGVEAFLFGAEHVDGDRVVVVNFEVCVCDVRWSASCSQLLPFGVRVGAKLLQSVPENAEVAASGVS